jgi:hypothetical protein
MKRNKKMADGEVVSPDDKRLEILGTADCWQLEQVGTRGAFRFFLTLRQGARLD